MKCIVINDKKEYCIQTAWKLTYLRCRITPTGLMYPHAYNNYYNNNNNNVL